MKHKQTLVSPLILLAVGLMIVAIVSIINHYTNLPDILKGTLVGFGIGLEIVAVIKLIKLKKNREVNIRQSPHS
jgi:uncharacterized membrane protein YoaK (UPF0700 family)